MCMNLRVSPVVDQWSIADPFIRAEGTLESYEYESRYGFVNVTLAERPDDKIHVVFKIPTYSTRVYEAVFSDPDLSVVNCRDRMRGICNATNVVEFLEKDQLFS